HGLAALSLEALVGEHRGEAVPQLLVGDPRWRLLAVEHEDRRGVRGDLIEVLLRRRKASQAIPPTVSGVFPVPRLPAGPPGSPRRPPRSAPAGARPRTEARHASRGPRSGPADPCGAARA